MIATTIYRVENEDQRGPYTSLGTGHWADTRHDDTGQHPSPSEEGLDFHRGRDLCGFESLEKLHTWFSDTELTCLEDYDYQIVEITLDNDYWIDYGQCQLVFDPAGIVKTELIQ